MHSVSFGLAAIILRIGYNPDTATKRFALAMPATIVRTLPTPLTEDKPDKALFVCVSSIIIKTLGSFRGQVASTAGGARYLVTNGHLGGLLVAAGGGEGESAAPPDPLLGASALRTLANVLAKAAGIGIDVSSSPTLFRADQTESSLSLSGDYMPEDMMHAMLHTMRVT